MYWLKYALPRPLIAVWEELTVVRSGQLPSGVVNSRQEWSALVSSRQLLSGVVSSRQEFSNFVRRCQFLVTAVCRRMTRTLVRAQCPSCSSMMSCAARSPHLVFSMLLTAVLSIGSGRVTAARPAESDCRMTQREHW